MTKAQQAEKQAAIVQLREWIKPGDTVYTILDSVSRSGMSRQIRVVLLACEGTQVESVHPQTQKVSDYVQKSSVHVVDLHPNHLVAIAIDARRAPKGDGIIMGGCGMDMGFALVYELGHVLYGAGYQCLGKGKCPSNYHRNHRDRVKCDGTLVRVDDGPNEGCFCYRADSSSAEEFRGKYIISDDEVEAICPTCHGEGYLPNPDGPERFDLVHTDGYALLHRWL